MNNEETILDPQSTTANQKPGANVVGKVIYGASGALAGSAATVAGQAIAAPSSTNDPVEDASTAVATETQSVEETPAPEPEETIIATATGVRVAQVDDEASFSQAFADARAQVGPGGIFEWHGRVYATYYKEEWDSMTPAKRHEFQTSIDYSDVIPDSRTTPHHDDMANNGPHHHNNGSHHNSNQQDNHSDDNIQQVSDDEVHVLEVGRVDLNGDGIPEDVAVIEVGGHEILLVDIDQNGTADIALCDVDGDGEPEYRDLTGDNLPMPAQSDGDLYYTQADNTPDYMNDANIDMC